MERFLQSGYEIDGETYYSFQDIGEYLFPDKCPVDAMNKTRYIYKYRKNDLQRYSKKTKSRIFNQTIDVLTFEGVKKLCGYLKRSDYNDRVKSLVK